MPNPIVSFDEEAVKSELRELVRKTIEETINAMLDEEAAQLVGAGPYERTDEHAAYRAGHYERGFTTRSGQVTLKMPKLKGMRFATAVIERYKRSETSAEEIIIEMYLAGASTRRIEDVSEIPWGAGVSAGTVSSLNDKAFKAVEEWRCRPMARLAFLRCGHHAETEIDLSTDLGRIQFSLACEVRDFGRFKNGASFSSHLGLVPSESPSGKKVSRGAIAKQGNSHLRRILVEAASCYSKQFKAVRSEDSAVPEAVRAKAEKCAARLRKRRAALKMRGVSANKAKVAVARELAEWIYHIAVMPA